jgi:hypothetical protein
MHKRGREAALLLLLCALVPALAISRADYATVAKRRAWVDKMMGHLHFAPPLQSHTDVYRIDAAFALTLCRGCTIDFKDGSFAKAAVAQTCKVSPVDVHLRVSVSASATRTATQTNPRFLARSQM